MHIKLSIIKSIIIRLVSLHFLLVLLSSYTTAQGNYTQYTTEDGLPSNYVYQAMQDQEGFMWFATEGGVSRYDGREFLNFTVEDGLPTNDIFQMIEDDQGRVWLQGVSNEIVFIKDLKVQRLEGLSDAIGTTKITGIYRFESGIRVEFLRIAKNLIIEGDEINPIEGAKNLKLNFLSQKGYFQYKDISKPNDFWFRKDHIIIKCDSNYFITDTLILKNYSRLRDWRSSFSNNDIKVPTVSQGGQITIVNRDEMDVVITLNAVELFDTIPSIYRFEQVKNSLQIQTNLGVATLLISDIMKGNTNSLSISKLPQYLNSSIVNRCFEGSNDLLWVLTKSEGVYKVKLPKFVEDGLNHVNITAIIKKDDELYTGSQSGQIISNDAVYNVYPSQVIVNDLSIKDFIYWNGHIVFSGDHIGVKKINVRTGQISNVNIFKQDIVRSLLSLGVKSEDIHFFRKDVNYSNDLTIIDDKLFSSGMTSILMYDLERESLNLISEYVNTSSISASSDLLFTSFEKTLKIWNHNFNLIKEFNLGETIVDLQNQNDVVYLLTKKGKIHKVDLNEVVDVRRNEGLDISVKSFQVHTEKVFLASDNAIHEYKLHCDSLVHVSSYMTPHLNCFYYENDTLYAGTKYGYQTIETQQGGNFQLSQKHKLEVFDITTRDVKLDSIFDRKNNDLGLKFTSLDYSIDGDYQVIMNVIADDTLEITSTDGTINFSNLEPNHYRIQYFFKDRIGRKSLTFEKSIIILPPWYLTAKAILLFVALLGLLFWSGSLFYVRRNRLKEEEKTRINTKIADLEINALQAQMNPHFVFNCLNSIQYLIQANESHKADQYLTRFSELMRSFLENSKSKFSTIEDEVKIVTNYIYLEQLRFGEKLDYIFHNNLSKEDMKVKIANNIVQPIVENAINHGLFHKKGKGQLFFTLTKSDLDLIVSVIDNGIGIRSSMLLKKRNNYDKKSISGSIIEDKLDILKKVYERDVEVIYRDQNDSSDSSGTKVEIVFRKVFKT